MGNIHLIYTVLFDASVVVSLNTKGEVEDMLRLMAVHADCLDVPAVINERSNGNVTLAVATFSFTVCFNSR